MTDEVLDGEHKDSGVQVFVSRFFLAGEWRGCVRNRTEQASFMKSSGEILHPRRLVGMAGYAPDAGVNRD